MKIWANDKGSKCEGSSNVEEECHTHDCPGKLKLSASINASDCTLRIGFILSISIPFKENLSRGVISAYVVLPTV